LLPVFGASGAVSGVDSNNEDPSPAVGSAGIGSSYNAPACVIPQRGKISEDGVESQGKVPCDVLQQESSGSKNANGVRDGGPQVALIG
jgi:hypothetical protein